MTAKETLQTQVQQFNAHDIEAFCSIYADDAVVHDPFYSEPLEGRAAIKKDMQEFWQAFPDAKNDIESMIDKDGACAAEMHLSGTHKGTLPSPEGEIEASGKPFDFQAGIFFRVNDRGKIVEEHRYYDVRHMLEQIGVQH